MTRIATFRQRLRRGDRVVGIFFKTPAPILAEVLSRTPLDTVCIDAEHAPFDRLSIDHCAAVFRLHDMPSLVRVPAARPEAILTALDSGATGVLVPHVRSAEEAAAVAKSARFGPGGRGYAGSTRAAGFGGVPIATHQKVSAETTTVIAQIEDLEALESIDDIVKVEGIDALFIGRIDLTVALGATAPDAPEVVEAVDLVVAKAREAGRTIGMFTPTAAEAVAWQAKGASFFLLGSEQAFIKAGADGLMAAFSGAEA